MKTTDIERLEQQIEHLIREHLAECTRRAMQAVERGFSGAKRTGDRRAIPTGHPEEGAEGEGERGWLRRT